MTVGIQADRLYVGDTLVWDAASAPTEAGWADLFDRAEIGPNYIVFNTLPGGASATASCSLTSGVTLGGYTPAAVRRVGRACRVFARSTSGVNHHVVSAYQDVNNWVSWTVANAGTGRIRHRENGVSRDVVVPEKPGISSEIAYQVTPEATTYYHNRVAVAADLSGALNIDHAVAGIGTASASVPTSFASLRAEPLTAPDVPAAIAAMNATATNSAIADALLPATEWAGARCEVETLASPPFTEPTAEGDPEAMAMAGIAAAELSRYPAGIHGRLAHTWRVRVGTGLVWGVGPVSGLYTNDHVVHVAKSPSAAHLADVSSDMATARASVVNHEVAHMLHLSTPFTAAKTTLDGAFSAANPTGFTYGTAGPRRPEGFCRGYGMTALAEDVADVFAWMQTDGLRPELISRVATDARLRAKVAAMKAFLAASGWSPTRFADIPT